jgi:hypothetical protein
MIAGVNIKYMPGVLVTSGGYMHGSVVPGGPFCITSPLVKSANAEEIAAPVVVLEQSFFKIYPNPTTGIFTLGQKGEKQTGNVHVEIFGLRGERVMTAEMIGERKHEFSLSGMPVGLYFVKVIAGDNVETIKLIKTN